MEKLHYDRSFIVEFQSVMDCNLHFTWSTAHSSKFASYFRVQSQLDSTVYSRSILYLAIWSAGTASSADGNVTIVTLLAACINAALWVESGISLLTYSWTGSATAVLRVEV